MFFQREKHTHAAWLIGHGSGGRTFCQIIFWLWGLGGLVVLLPGVPGVVGLSGLGSVPTLLYWIGGLLVFGIGGALTTSDYDFKRPVDAIHLGE